MVVFILCHTAHAATVIDTERATIDLGGFYKNYFMASETSSDTGVFRFNLDATLWNFMSTEVHYQNNAVISNADITISHRMDRLNATFDNDAIRLTVGRQAISYGSGRIWSPIDMIGAFSPTDIDREYKQGVDAIKLGYSLGSLSQIQAVVAPRDNWDQTRMLVYGHSTISKLEYSLIVGDIYNDGVFGGDLQIDVFDAGLRTEYTYTITEGDPNYASIVAGLDYQFQTGPYVLAEYYYNGIGATDVSNYNQIIQKKQYQEARVFNLGKHYGALMMGYDITGIISVSLLGIMNLNDHSMLVNPTINVSMADNVSAVFGAQLNFGKEYETDFASEFGAYPHLYVIQMNMYF